MLVELEMFTQCPSKGLGQGGKPCQEIGGRIGKAIPTSMAKASLFRSPQVMEGLSLATTLCLIIGNLDKYLKGHNSRYHLSSHVPNTHLQAHNHLGHHHEDEELKCKPARQDTLQLKQQIQLQGKQMVWEKLGFWIDLGRAKSLVGKTGLFERGDGADYGYGYQISTENG
ncbi:hypothetical protein Fmac_028457 [Flemingia macrophylla]|uniref:Uncharacterized protein n=1 Tax=Flemingia macrophylla TaxID=520843 RepID=A0ABD1L7Z5_9FABA